MAANELVVEGDRVQTEVEVSGRAILQVVETMPSHAAAKAREVLDDVGIEDPREGEWYPREAWIAALEVVERRLGEATLRELGTTVVGDIRMPSGATDLDGAVEAVDRAYRANLRGPVDDGYRVLGSADDRVVVRCETPHPPAFDEAVLRETARTVADGGCPAVTDVSDEYNAEPGAVYDLARWKIGE